MRLVPELRSPGRRPSGRRWRAPLTTGYVAVLVVMDVVLAYLPPALSRAVESWASTDVAHLIRVPAVVLPASAFVDPGRVPIWPPLMLLLLGLLERRAGSRAVLAVAGGGHVLATVLSQGMLLVRVLAGTLPGASVHMVDIGPSYVLVAAVGGLLVLGGWHGWALGGVVLGALASPLLAGLTSADVTAVGHVLALGCGITLALVVRARRAGARAVSRALHLERLHEIPERLHDLPGRLSHLPERVGHGRAGDEPLAA